jgi:hypothetical protein
MPGLDPGISPRPERDGWVKPGHDEAGHDENCITLWSEA